MNSTWLCGPPKNLTVGNSTKYGDLYFGAHFECRTPFLGGAKTKSGVKLEMSAMMVF